MVNGTFNFLLNPRDFAGQRFGPLVKLFNRKRVKILLEQQGQGVIRPLGKEFVKIHSSES